MDREQWQRVEEIFHAALERSDNDRGPYLDHACMGDPGLREEVLALLAYDDVSASFMETPALVDQQVGADPAEIPTILHGGAVSDTPGGSIEATDALPASHVIGNFRIVHKIGEGGMGEVYLAEDLKLGRRVAIKLLPTAIAADARAARKVLREARAASALNHPHIVTIHAVEEAAGHSFIVMEHIDGESLRERLLRGPLELADVISLGLEAADAATAAHAINIVHRDLKPGNILFTGSGKAKIVDFGLARAAGAASSASAETVLDLPPGLSSFSVSQVGSISGTVPYMSPEQTRGEHVDARSDIFSLGCVLYEAATGRRPFEGDRPAQIIPKIREREPLRASVVRPGLPRGLDRILSRALTKDPRQRYASMGELAADLRRLRTTQGIRGVVRRTWLPATVTLLIVAVTALWFNWRRGRITWAEENVPRVKQLVDEFQFFEAHDLAQQIAAITPDDPALKEVRPWIIEVLSVNTDPPGARVHLQRYQPAGTADDSARQLIGTTPIHDLEIARGEYLLSIEKEGYVPVRRSLSNALNRLERGFWNEGMLREAELTIDDAGDYGIRLDSRAPIQIEVALFEEGAAPEGMVFIPGSRYRLVGGGRPSNEFVELDDFFIDQCEVTNRDFQEFVESGGYADQRYWKHSFTRYDSESNTVEELTWEEAVALLVDRRGKPGPRNWSQGRYPTGKDDHPVTHVTWYEAAAYAAFRGKRLPTIFQWEKAARDGQLTHLWGTVKPWGLVMPGQTVVDRANVNGGGTMPVASFPFGLSPYGCYDMLGNVWEWCANPRPLGFTSAGGSWREGPNLFSAYGQFPGFYSADTLGFRCVLGSSGAEDDQGGMFLPNTMETPQRESLSEEAFRLIRTFYEYDHPSPERLHAEILEQVQMDQWTRLKVSYFGANGLKLESGDFLPDHERALAYLWLPKNARPPYQVVNYKPGAASNEGLMVPQETEVVCGPFLDAGRAVFVVVIEGMTERDLPPNWKHPEVDTVAYRDMLIYDTLDQRVGLDYLATRDDIDMEKIICMGLSQGSHDLVTMAVEDRFQGIVLLAAGLGIPAKRVIDAADPVNFAPYIAGRKLMIQGRYDESIPFESHARPLYEMLSGQEGVDKELVVLDSGHFPPMDQWVPHALRFLDETLGPVETTGGSIVADSAR